MHRISLTLFCAVCFVTFHTSSLANASPPELNQRLILAHFMPWFECSPKMDSWGWHWTMNAFDPKQIKDGRAQIASHFHPLIGPYDSGDHIVLEYHLLLMKLAGIDGIIVDWYGLQDFRDYALLHRNTQRIIDLADASGMKFAICYEDQTIPALVQAGRLNSEDRTQHAAAELNWIAENWFVRKGYVRLDDRPLLISFGQDGLTNDEWSSTLNSIGNPPLYLSQHHRRNAAQGAFDWPLPKEGIQAQSRFLKESASWKHTIPVAFPRFVDIYAEAKVHASWGRIEDEQGETFRTTVRQAIDAKQQIIQIATWNDWSEGTMIEPSDEFQYRDLEVLQQIRLETRGDFAPTREDLRLPLRLYRLRRAHANDSEVMKKLDSIARDLFSLRMESGRKALAE